MGMMDTIKALVGAGLKKNLSSYNSLETCDGFDTIVAKDGSLMTIFRIDGTKKMMGKKELDELVEQASEKFSPYLGQPGHAIQMWFLRDRTRAKDVVKHHLAPAKIIADELNLDIDDLLAERVRHMSKYIVHEGIYLAVWTRTSILSAQELGRLKLEMQRPPLWPAIIDTQDLFANAKTMTYRHRGFVSSIEQDLNTFLMKYEKLNCSEALKAIKTSLYPEMMGSEWKPYIPIIFNNSDDEAAFYKKQKPLDYKNGYSRIPYPRGNPQYEGDLSPLLWPRLDDQLFDRGATVINNQIVKMGQYYYCGIDMIMGPQDTKDFGDLLSRLKDEPYPWRVSFLLEGDNFTTFNFMAQIAAITAFTNSDNRNIKAVMNAIKEYKQAGGVSCKYRVSFATWAPEPSNVISETERLDVIEEYAARLQRNIEAWGYCQAAPAAGDPMAGAMSSVLGINVASTAPVGIPPIPEAVRMLPWNRAAAPFKDGSVLFRTEDGRPWSWQPGSSEQDTFIDIIFAPPGKGKSVLMNTTNLAFCLSPKVNMASDGAKLPRIAIIDIGHSSSGLISLLKEDLPTARRHEVMAFRLKMTRENSINPFDTQLGCRKPLSQEKSFLVNFITLLATDPSEEVAPRGMSDLASRAIDELYERYSDRTAQGMAKPYVESEDKEVDNALKAHNILMPPESTWWDVVDELYEKGDYRHAMLAQRYAVPLISDLGSIVNIPQITDIYGDATIDGNERLIVAFQRTISSALRAYPILSQSTKFDIGDSRIVSMNLEEVAPAGDRKQTSMVYMLARYVMARDFYLNKDNIREIPADYRDYHEARIRRNAQTPKRLVYDEFHRTKGSDSVRRQVETDMREGRKWGVEISLASQIVTDFSEVMTAMATGFWILGANNADEREGISRMFELSDTAKRLFKTKLNGPTPSGAPFITVLNMKDGTHEHLLYNTLGPMEMWAFSTTHEDVAIRNNLYARLGPKKARRLLARRFEGGTAKKEVERRMNEFKERGDYNEEEGNQGILEAIANEIVAMDVDEH